MYLQRWNLECFFQGGSQSKPFRDELESLAQRIRALEQKLERELSISLLTEIDQLDGAIKECDAFILCLESQNSKDETASQLRVRYCSLEAEFQKRAQAFDRALLNMSEQAFNAFLGQAEVKPYSYVLQERRRRASSLLEKNAEELATELAVDGYHSWNEMYSTLVASTRIPFKKEGKVEMLTAGQADNLFAHPDRAVRQEVFSEWEKAWTSKEREFSQVLNHLAGFRLALYHRRGWQDPLHESLLENRMQRETLDAMWGVVEANRAPFIGFLKQKGRMLGVERLSWYDLEASLPSEKPDNVPYEDAAELIIERFSQFHKGMGAFAKLACQEEWIDAEDRSDKRPGGFCVPFIHSKQSRIFMTYSGSMQNILTLAHELGHGYHSYVIRDLPPLLQNYKMNVAETASTFAEQLIFDALIEESTTREGKLKLLGDRLQRSATFFMNIYARFLFETEFYKARSKEFLLAGDLNALMTSAQKRAYGDALDVWHPHFWVSKLHFYFTGVPFYNYPYAFGYLLSLGLSARVKKERNFAEKYDAFLRDSGQMETEALVLKHWGADLRKPDFWQEAVDEAKGHLKEFVSLMG